MGYQTASAHRTGTIGTRFGSLARTIWGESDRWGTSCRRTLASRPVGFKPIEGARVHLAFHDRSAYFPAPRFPAVRRRGLTSHELPAVDREPRRALRTSLQRRGSACQGRALACALRGLLPGLGGARCAGG